MVFRKSTRYGLYAALELARAGTKRPVTVAQVAEHYGISVSALAKVFQRLARAGLARSTRGVLGGYGLARGASEISVLEVIEAFESPRGSGHCLLVDEGESACGELSVCRLRELIDEVDEMTRCTYASVTLETLVGNRPTGNLELRVVR